MVKIFSFIFFSYLLSPFSLLAETAELSDTSLDYSLRISKLAHDFGSVRRGEKLEHTFQIYNDGEESVEILEIRPSCGCTTATEAPFSIPPGESRSLDFSVDTKGRTGRMEQRIGVVTSDLNRQEIDFYLTGNIQAGAVLNKTFIRFDQVRQKKGSKQKIIVSSQNEEPIAVQQVRSSVAFLQFEIGKRHKKKGFTPIKIQVPKNAPPGPFKGWVYVITDEELDPTYWIRVYGNIISS